MIRRSLILACAAFIVITSPASAAKKTHFKKGVPEKTAAQKIEDAESTDELVTVEPPKSLAYKKAALFPLELPVYAFRALTLPLGMVSRAFERKHVIEHITDFLSNDEKTFYVYPIIEGGAGSGFGGGAGLKHVNLFGREYQLSAYYKIHVNFDQWAGAEIKKPDAFEIFGTPVSWSFSPRWKRLEHEHFYGVGNSTNQNAEADYMINQTDIMGGIAMHPMKELSIGLGLGYSLAATGNDDTPYISAAFPAATLTGFDKWLQYGIAGLRIEHDTRDNKSLPESGGLRSFSFARYQCFSGGNLSYNEFRFDLKHFFRLGGPRYVLALHTGWVFQQETGGSQIPFYRLAVLDVYSPLRGFSRQRFVDRNTAVFNAEYRFPLWGIMDGVIFGDTGRVFHSITDFSFDGFKYSAGGGLMFRAQGLMIFRFDVAYGGEGVNFLFGMTKSL